MRKPDVSMQKDDLSDVVFKVKRSIRNDETILHFQELQIDGKTVDPAYYRISEGSLVLLLGKSYIGRFFSGIWFVCFCLHILSQDVFFLF